MMIDNNNYLQNIYTDCLIVPSKVFDGNKKKNFILSVIKNDCKNLKCSKSSDHAYQIYPINLLRNIIFIDTIIPAFFSIVNTKNMPPNGIITLKKNSKINLIKISDLNNNDETTTNIDLNGNICHDPDDSNNNFKFNFSQDAQIQNTSINYNDNPVIYFFGDYNACSLEKQNLVNNLFVYFDYGDQIQLTTCLNKMKFNIVKSGNTTINFNIPFSVHGSQYNDFKSRNFTINFDPRDISNRDGFITIINTKNTIEDFYQVTSDPIFDLYNKYKSSLTLNKDLKLIDYINNNNITNDVKSFDLVSYNNNITTYAINAGLDEDTIFDFIDFVTQLTETATIIKQSVISYSSTAPQSITSYSSNIASDIASQYSSNAPSQYSSETPVSQTIDSIIQQNTTRGSINFSQDLIRNLKINKKSCLYVKFWLSTFNFGDNKVISVDDIKGPYKQINFVGNPKIIIYIPPYVLNEDDRKNIITSLIQEKENICDIYINISY